MFKCRCAKDNFFLKSASFMLSNHPLKLHHNMMNYQNSLNREYYEVTDFDLWMESNMEKGLKLVNNRISENSKYLFNVRRLVIYEPKTI